MTVEDSVLTAGSDGDGRRRSSAVEAVAAAVAHHVKALRQARSWSLDELGHRSGVSKGMIVQIEAGRTNPSIGTLCRLADSFGVSVARLIEAEPEPSVRLIHADEPRVLWRGELGGTARLLVGVNDPAVVELWEWEIAAGERHRSVDHAPDTRELLHVRSGALVVTVDGVDHPVAAGETIDFRANRSHGYRNDGPGPAIATMVVAMPADEWDRRATAPPADQTRDT
jgi:transcriptional regulator with XRE-family HTH domain